MEQNWEIFRNMKTFKWLNDKELNMITGITEERIFNHDETIIKMKETGSSMFIIKSGGVNVYFKGGSGEFILGHFEAGEIFGEMAIFDDEPRSALVKAFGNTTVLEIPKSKFFNLLEEGFSKGTAIKLLSAIVQNLCHRLRSTSSDLYVSMGTGRELTQEEIDELKHELEALQE